LALACLALVCHPVKAQQQNSFRYKADIVKTDSGKAFNIDSSGVYRIWLDPRFIAKSVHDDFSDIRLMDDGGSFVAYSLTDGASDEKTQTFVPLSEIKQNKVSDTATVYIADAGIRGVISQLWLTFKNTEVERLANLSGSDDLQHWYAIKEGIILQGSTDNNKPEYEQVLNFPVSNYRYYRIQVNNKKGDPIKIIKSGVYTSLSYAPYADKVKPAGVVVKNEQSRTSYFITFDDYFDLLDIQPTVLSVKPYNRVVIVYDISKNVERKIYEGRISSFSPPDFIRCPAKTNRVRIDILNGDDSPLVFKDIVAWARRQYAVAFLEKGHKYSLLTGDSTAKAMSYDLAFLHSKPVDESQVIKHSAVYKNPAFGAMLIARGTGYTQYIWLAIIVLLIVLGSLTLKMVKEVGKKQGD